jgi:hypothetical protein
LIKTLAYQGFFVLCGERLNLQSFSPFLSLSGKGPAQKQKDRVNDKEKGSRFCQVHFHGVRNIMVRSAYLRFIQTLPQSFSTL